MKTAHHGDRSPQKKNEPHMSQNRHIYLDPNGKHVWLNLTEGYVDRVLQS